MCVKAWRGWDWVSVMGWGGCNNWAKRHGFGAENRPEIRDSGGAR